MQQATSTEISSEDLKKVAAIVFGATWVPQKAFNPFMICGIFASFWHVDETNRGLVCYWEWTSRSWELPASDPRNFQWLWQTLVRGNYWEKKRKEKERPSLESSELSFLIRSVEFDLGARSSWTWTNRVGPGASQNTMIHLGCHRETFWARTAWKGTRAPGQRKGGWTHSLRQLQPSLNIWRHVCCTKVREKSRGGIRKPQESWEESAFSQFMWSNLLAFVLSIPILITKWLIWIWSSNNRIYQIKRWCGLAGRGSQDIPPAR